MYKCYTPISRRIEIFTIEHEFNQKIIKILNDTWILGPHTKKGLTIKKKTSNTYILEHHWKFYSGDSLNLDLTQNKVITVSCNNKD